MLELRLHQRVQLGERTDMALSALPVRHDHRGPVELWEHCRNSLGIARILHHEGRAEVLVATACHLAVETACRTALDQLGFDYDGDLELALARLGAPRDVWELQQAGPAGRRLAAAERAVAWFASYLRHAAPGRTWGY
jgi:hypothetical protein